MFCDRCGSAVAASAAECPRCRASLAPVGLVPASQPRGAGAWLADGWTAVTSNFWVFVLLTVVFLIGGSTIPILLQGPLALGLQWAALRQVSGHRASFNDLGIGFNLFPQAVMVCLVTMLIYVAASLLLVFPALIAATLLQFPYLLVLDRKLDFWSAIKESSAVSQRHLGSLLGLAVLQFALLVAGLLLCGVGLLVALPVCYAASAVAYVELFGLRESTRSAIVRGTVGAG